MTHSTQDADAVLLDRLPGAPTVPSLAPLEISVDLRSADRQPGREPLQDPEQGQSAIFADEIWAQEYQQALGAQFLPPVIKIAVADPYADRTLFAARVREISERIQGVQSVNYYRETYKRLASGFARIDRMWPMFFWFGAGLFLVACVALETLRSGYDDLNMLSGDMPRATSRVSSNDPLHLRCAGLLRWLIGRLAARVSG